MADASGNTRQPRVIFTRAILAQAFSAPGSSSVPITVEEAIVKDPCFAMALVKITLGCLVLPLASAILTLRRAGDVCLANGLFEEAQVGGSGEWSSVSGEHDSCKDVSGLLAVRMCGPGTLTVYEDLGCKGKKSTATMPTSAVNGTSASDYTGCTGGENGITVSNKNIMSYKVTCAQGLTGE